MTEKRYAVLDGNNKVVNHILLDDPLPKGYWPGYGKTLLPIDKVSTSKGGAGLDVVIINTSTIPQIGDTVDLTTGTVTKFAPQIITQDGTQVSSAPKVKFTKDAEAKPDGGTITDKTGSK